MKKIKSGISVILVISLLCVIPIFSHGQESDGGAKVYPVIILDGGWHMLRYDTEDSENQVAFDQMALGPILEAHAEDLLAAVQKLDLNAAMDVLSEAMWELLGPVRMDKNGESVAKITDAMDIYADENVEGGEIIFSTDWRIDPVENAVKLHEFITYCKEKLEVNKFNVMGRSASGAILLSYLALYGSEDFASTAFILTTHSGSAAWGGIAKKEMYIDPEGVLALLPALLPALVDADMGWLEPILRALFETGVLDALSVLAKKGLQTIIDRAYDEILIPLFFMMPVFWSYVPARDFEAAKAALLQGNPKYAGLVAKLDRCNEIRIRADEIIQKTAEDTKVGIRVSYGFPLLPAVRGSAVQADIMVETSSASLGATCVPLGKTFSPFYRQKVKDGHNHISPDRAIDASTCLLPEQTWFALNKAHGPEESYSGWYDWFIRTDNPTVFDNPQYPQYVVEVEPGVFEPLVAEPEDGGVLALLLGLLGTAVLWLFGAWRQLLWTVFDRI